MRSIWILSLSLIGLGILLSLLLLASLPSAPPSVSPSGFTPASTPEAIRYEVYTSPQSVVHILEIPSQSGFLVAIALSPELNTLENFVQQYETSGVPPIAALNGGFFDPTNQKSTSYIILQGQLAADPQQNERLMQNPDLAPYLDQILNRTEFRQYLCGKTIRYDITFHQDPPLTNCRIIEALGGGPRLLPEMTLEQEGFVDYANGAVVRDPLGSSQPNARSAVGIANDGSTIILAMAAQKPNVAINSGMSLEELAGFLKNLGVEKAMNLDGGSSASFYYNGETFYGKVGEDGNLIRRPVKSILVVQED